MEIVDRHDTNTYRAVYTVQFAGTIYVLHAFQKKSKKGIATPPKDIDLIRQRLAAAEGPGERQCLCRSRPAACRAGAAEGAPHAADIQDHQRPRPHPGQGWGNPWHQAAARLGADAQPGGDVFCRAPDGVPDPSRAGRGDHRAPDAQGAWKSFRCRGGLMRNRSRIATLAGLEFPRTRRSSPLSIASGASTHDDQSRTHRRW